MRTKSKVEKCLGTIRLDGEALVVTDPCYLKPLAPGTAGIVDSGLAGHGVVEGIPAGEYPVWVELSDEGEWGTRVQTLWLQVLPAGRDAARTERVGDELGVDSGQMSMLSMSQVPEWETDPMDAIFALVREETEVWLDPESKQLVEVVSRERTPMGATYFRPVWPERQETPLPMRHQDFNAKFVSMKGKHPVTVAALANVGRFNYCGACALTLGDEGLGRYGGVIDGRMAVSSSGYGDGSYPLFVHRTADGEIAAVSVDFFGDEDDEDDDDDR